MADTNPAGERGSVVGGSDEPAPDADSDTTSSSPSGHSRLSDVLGVAWVVIAAVLMLLPALVHGTSYGPIDILRTTGLTSISNVKIHNSVIGDQIRLFLPWTNLVWTQVHQGHLPLWNPYSALGSPLAFNWESAPLSIPVLVGYLFPVHLAYTAQIIVTLLIAGTGVYVLGRVLGLSPLGCAMAATVFELSGPVIGWLGWPNTSVMAWLGWVFAALVLILRGKRRGRSIVFFAVILACAVYAGDPEEVLVSLGLSTAVFAFATLALRTPALRGSGPVRRPLVDLIAASAAGGALAAPLILPGLQLASKSNRFAVGPTNGPKTLPLSNVVHLVFQSFDGLPLIHSQWFGYSNYVETAVYIGVIPLVLAVMTVVLRAHQREVLAFGALVVATGAIVFLPPLVSFLDKFVIGTYWLFAMQPMVLGIAVLSGMGIDIIRSHHRERRVRRVLGIGFALAAVLLALVWLLAEGGLPKKAASIRAHSFIWPAIEVVVGLAVAGALVKLAGRPLKARLWQRVGVGSLAGFVLLACGSAFLVNAGAAIPSTSSTYLTPTPAVTALKAAVGSSVVGFGVPCNPGPRVGILENVNIVYGIQEISSYDPMTPRAFYDQNWLQTTGVPGGKPEADNFCPVFPTARLARLWGVGYVLVFPGFPGPEGSVFVKKIGDEDLYRIPGVSAAELVSPTSRNGFPNVNASGTPVAVSGRDTPTWRIVTDATSAKVLRVHLSNVPGWHATVNGRPLALEPFDGAMLQTRLPAGHDVVELNYYPTSFTEGLVVAACALGALLAMLAFESRRRKTRLP